MLDWWMDQPSWVRYGAALFLVGLGAVLFFLGSRRGAWVAAPGVGLLLVAGKSESEKKGYRF